MSVDKERFAATVAQGGGTGTGALGFVFREKPDAGGNLGIGEELAGQGDHVVPRSTRDLRDAFGFQRSAFARGSLDKIRLDQGAADVALAAGIRTHRAIGEQQRHRAIRREVVEHVLDPGEVGIPLRRRAVFASFFVELSMRR